MKPNQTKCKKCKAVFLKSTAEETNGICLGCVNGTNNDSFTTGEKVELSFRITFALIFAFTFAFVGFGLGSTIWSGVGIFVALVAFPVGFIYGFFMLEINTFFRIVFGSIFSNQ